MSGDRKRANNAGVIKAQKWRRRLAAAICSAVALAALVAAGRGLAGTPLQVTITEQQTSSTPPQVTADLSYDGSDQWLLTVMNASSNPPGENITEIDGGLAQAALQRGFFINQISAQSANPSDAFVASSQSGFSLLFSEAPVNVCFQPPSAQTSFSCPTMYGGFGPGSTEEYVLTTNDTTESVPPLSVIDVHMKIGDCDIQTHPSRRLASASDSCTPPGVTTIKKATVDQQARTALFVYGAADATAYVCELLHDKHIVNRTACYSAKRYTNLGQGTYYFLVWAVNKAGVAQKATVYGFKTG